MKLTDLITDPVACKLSSARACGILVAAGGLGFAFVHPSDTATLTALLGYSALALGLRARATATTP
jgi:hypothetical protein